MLENPTCIKIAQLSLVFTISTSILYVYSWPFAFLFPLLCLHIRFYELAAMPLREYVTLFFVAFSGIAFGFGISFLYPISPALFVAVLGASIFSVHFWDKQKPHQLHTALRVISVVLVSAITMADHSIVPLFTLSLVVSLLLAMMLCYVLDKLVAYFYKHEDMSAIEHHHEATAHEPTNEWQALLIFLPATFIFIWLELFYYYVALVAICVLTLNPDLAFIRNNSKQYLVANLLGCSIALGGYALYAVFEPYIDAKLLLVFSVTFLMSTLLGVIIYRTQFNSIAQFVLSPFALLFVQSDRVDFNIFDNYQLRLVSVFMAVVYVYVAAQIVASYREKSHKKHNKKPA
ncbi:hypothetical protein VIN01S_29500 [Vibrio inusitatus NBRC 102082]|uniref:DUF2955 domain-containing protein n=1 Tax=Vibrio inusitatus NBRC 102082 TaxID=1219070 RepID=A0A4Y3HYE3_9VIBR|nr:hypothetical protein [Vibrio inusitatus]GEA52146.1 hypothetical protein VIN01S_29500 [Vibrio inusitatus NBRC 102082]